MHMRYPTRYKSMRYVLCGWKMSIDQYIEFLERGGKLSPSRQVLRKRWMLERLIRNFGV